MGVMKLQTDIVKLLGLKSENQNGYISADDAPTLNCAASGALQTKPTASVLPVMKVISAAARSSAAVAAASNGNISGVVPAMQSLNFDASGSDDTFLNSTSRKMMDKNATKSIGGNDAKLSHSESTRCNASNFLEDAGDESCDESTVDDTLSAIRSILRGSRSSGSSFHKDATCDRSVALAVTVSSVNPSAVGVVAPPNVSKNHSSNSRPAERCLSKRMPECAGVFLSWLM